MKQFKCVFRVNGVRTEQVVSAWNSADAKKLIEAQYCGNVQWISCLPM